ncbi:hypothetical protein BCR32DRAFT_325849 [Anaeromyces robustus]|uniref:Uncharacterized protein n=1 Tax=Anaeromyces robustus TaxID=1754192 RepID=A0A1Y1XFS0_9FUNG|nr:hypothetical protein BCR32DRAFT_325849 [Anaeromyces robustus]|eukprot:ORX84595.1 hypothetical protein BCR32DRAFT_325849 [Anaeromyces robustus]
MEKGCNVLTSKKCKKFYEKPNDYLDKCDDDTKEVYLEGVKKIVELKKYSCTQDGGGNYCPIISLAMTNDSKTIKALTSEEEDNIIKSTCKSKYCTEALRDFIIQYKNYFTDTKKILEYLNSEECTKENDAKSLSIISGSLIFTLITFLAFLY